MIVIGILGGIASGKSTISNYFKELNINVINADKLVHEILRQEDIKNSIKNNWENTVTDNLVDRRKLADIVFKNYKELEKLQNIIIPILNKKILNIYNLCEANKEKYLVLDIPLLIESGWNNYCDYLIFKQCHKKVRIKRFAERNKYDLKEAAQELHRRESIQFPLEMKETMANFKIADLLDYREQIDLILKQIEKFN